MLRDTLPSAALIAILLMLQACVDDTSPNDESGNQSTVPLRQMIDASVAALDDAGAHSTGEIPCEVALILETRCRVCHDGSLTAPPPQMTTVEDFAANSFTAPPHSVALVANARIGSEGDARMPPPASAPLAEDELLVLQDWLSAGAPSGDACSLNDASSF